MEASNHIHRERKQGHSYGHVLGGRRATSRGTLHLGGLLHKSGHSKFYRFYLEEEDDDAVRLSFDGSAGIERLQRKLLPDGEDDPHDMRDLFSSGSDDDAIDDPGALCALAAEGLLVEMRELLETDVSPDLCDSHGMTPLHSAASCGREAAVRLLLEKGASVDIFNHKGYTPLHTACMQGHSACVHVLLKHGANARAVSADGRTPLHFAAEAGSSFCARELLSKGVAVDVGDDEGRTPLHFACISGDMSVVTRLLKSGARVQAQDNQGRDAFQIALTMNNEMLLQLLHSEAGAVANALGTPLASHRDNTYVPSGRFVIISTGLLVEDSNERVILHHAKEAALRYANSLVEAASYSADSIQIGFIDEERWYLFVREVAFSFYDEDPVEEDVLMQEYMRLRKPGHVKLQEEIELESRVLELSKEIDECTLECECAERGVKECYAQVEELQQQCEDLQEAKANVQEHKFESIAEETKDFNVQLVRNDGVSKSALPELEAQQEKECLSAWMASYGIPTNSAHAYARLLLARSESGTFAEVFRFLKGITDPKELEKLGFDSENAASIVDCLNGEAMKAKHQCAPTQQIQMPLRMYTRRMSGLVLNEIDEHGYVAMDD